MELNAVLHPSAERVGRFLAPWMVRHPWGELSRGPFDAVVADFSVLTVDEVQRVLQFLPQRTLFVHAGEELQRPVFATHWCSPLWEDAGMEWQARRIYLDAAARRAGTVPFSMEGFAADLLGFSSGILGLRKGDQTLTFCFQDGRLIHRMGVRADLRLGAILAREKQCGDEALQDALRCQAANGLPLGECLVKRERLPRERLATLLRDQALLTAGAMAQFLPADEIRQALTLNAEAWEPLKAGRRNLLQAFLRGLSRWPSAVPGCAVLTTEVVRTDEASPPAGQSFSPSQYFLLNQLGAPVPWKTAFAATPGNLFDKEKDAFYLCVTGAVRVISEARPPETFDEAVAMARKVGGMTFFQILGVRESSGDDEVRAAYFTLAKRFHPDKFSKFPEFQGHRAMLENLFATINQAYQILSDPAERLLYLRTLDVDKYKTTDPDERARLLYGEARTAVSKKQYSVAAQRLNEILYMKKGDAKILLLLGMCLFKGENKLREAESALRKCLSLDPREADAHYYLGQIYSRENMKARAVGSFRKALELNPTHLDAAQGLKDLENA